MTHTEAQLNTLRELRTMLLECGFEIYDIVKRYRKHPLEFVMIEKTCHANMSSEERPAFTSAIVRLYRKTKVRVHFLEVGVGAMAVAGWRDMCRRILSLNGRKGCSAVVFKEGYRNSPNCRFKKRFWYEFVYQRKLKKTGLAQAIQQFKNTGIVLKKGTRTLA